MAYVLCTLLCTVLCCAPCCGQSRKERFKTKLHRVDSTMMRKYHKGNFDTAYVSRPPQRLLLKIRPNVMGMTFHHRGNIAGLKTKADFHTDPLGTLSLCASIYGITAIATVNPASLGGRKKDTEMGLNYYSPRLCMELNYQTSKTLSGDVLVGDIPLHMRKGLMGMKVGSANAYYVFNHRRFSYPAAFNQTFVQKKSAGSWLVGLNFEIGEIKRTEEARYIPFSVRTFFGQVAIGGGYAYNFVLGRKWMLHLSAVPNLVVVNFNKITLNGNERSVGAKFPSAIMKENVTVIYNQSSRCFWGATGSLSNSLFNTSGIRFYRNKWVAQLYFGIRLF